MCFALYEFLFTIRPAEIPPIQQNISDTEETDV